MTYDFFWISRGEVDPPYTWRLELSRLVLSLTTSWSLFLSFFIEPSLGRRGRSCLSLVDVR
jgi:hypothetical protein